MSIYPFFSITKRVIQSELNHSLLYLEQGKNVNQNVYNRLPCVGSLFLWAKEPNLEAALGHLGLVIPHHLLKTHAHSPTRLPFKRCLGTRRVGPTLLRVILWQALIYDIDAAGSGDTIFALPVFDDVADEVGKFENCEFVAIAEVDGSCLARIHQRDQAVD